MEPQPLTVSRTGFLGLSGYHWLVVAAGWAGWGFDVFDALLFNFVAPNCIPALLHLVPGSPAAHAATVFWTGAITSLLLLAWAAGGVVFGWIADRIGRRRALFATIALYAAGTGMCALVSSLWQLILFRTIAGLGIGGEWGIGAALVAESVPEHRRIEAGVIMQTASPLGAALATAVNYQIAGVWFANQPQSSWRYVFLAGLLPVLVALGVRLFVRESASWEASRARTAPSTPRELFAPGMVANTLSGFFVSVVPARLRATGAGFCYNIGRILAAGGPFVVGLLSAMAGGSSSAITRILFWVALVPLSAALLGRFLIVETRGRALPA